MNKINEKERRIYRFEIRLNEMENSKLTYDSLTARIPKSELIRNLIINTEVKQKPDRDFYELIDSLSRIYIRLTQLVDLAKNNNHIDSEEIKKQGNYLKHFVNEMEKNFL